MSPTKSLRSNTGSKVERNDRKVYKALTLIIHKLMAICCNLLKVKQLSIPSP
jgi:hypothetical protein